MHMFVSQQPAVLGGLGGLLSRIPAVSQQLPTVRRHNHRSIIILFKDTFWGGGGPGEGGGAGGGARGGAGGGGGLGLPAHSHERNRRRLTASGGCYQRGPPKPNIELVCVLHEPMGPSMTGPSVGRPRARVTSTHESNAGVGK